MLPRALLRVGREAGQWSRSHTGFGFLPGHATQSGCFLVDSALAESHGLSPPGGLVRESRHVVNICSVLASGSFCVIGKPDLGNLEKVSPPVPVQW